MVSTKGKEIEFKYDANTMDFKTFTTVCEEKSPNKLLITSGFDHFYGHTSKKTSFYRYRTGNDINQLTFKRKMTASDNFIRVEHNMNLSAHSNKEQVDELCRELGYRYNTSLFKTCFIYVYDKHIAVMYICYNTKMQEIGRFFELEVNEDIEWKSVDEAWNYLLQVEEDYRALGISEEARIKLSLWEMFKKLD